MHQQDENTQEPGSSMKKGHNLLHPDRQHYWNFIWGPLISPEKEHIPDTHVTWSTHGSRYDGRPDLHTFNRDGYDVSERL